jgi:peroxiredoxin
MQTHTSLGSTLSALRDKYAALLKPNITAVMDGHIENLRAIGFAGGAKNVGDRMPAFVLKDRQGSIVSSADLLKRAPLVVTFFRGTWCPYCTAELGALSQIADDISKAGGSIVAISPQAPERQDAKAPADINFPVLYDRDNAVGKQFALVYDFPDDLKRLYQNVFENDIAVQNGVESWQLPVPARYVVSRDGQILDAQIDPFYRYRPEPLVTLSMLKQYTRT